MAANTLIELEDQGQDMYELLVSDTGEIIEAGPFQNHIFKGDKVLNIASVGEGSLLSAISGEGERYTFKYPVVSVKKVIGHSLSDLEEV